MHNPVLTNKSFSQASKLFLAMKKVVAVLLLLVCLSAAGQKKPNVIFIMVDDLRTDLACYGNRQVQSPHIDKLAAQGLRFTKAYVQQAVCGPSRASIMTGQYPDKLGILTIETPLRRNHPAIPTLPQLFKEKGYKTISVGKVYHHTDDDKENWSYYDERIREQYASIATRTANAEGQLLNKAYRGPATEAADLPDSAYSDYQSVDRALAQLQLANGQPFFLCLGFYKPHLPFVAPKKYWDLYDRNKLGLADTTTPEGASVYAGTDWGEMRNYSDIPKGTAPVTPEKAAELKHGYYACISFVDAQVGRFLAGVKKLGLDKNTIIVFTSDHGWKLGEYGLWSKHTNYELDTHIPMLLKIPGLKGGSVSHSLVQNADILPTLADLCRLRKVPTEGKSFAALLVNPSARIHDFAFSLFPRPGVMGHSLTNGRYRYTRWVSNSNFEVLSEELYDHSTTDVAKKNISSDPAFAHLKQQFAVALDKVRPRKKPL